MYTSRVRLPPRPEEPKVGTIDSTDGTEEGRKEERNVLPSASIPSYAAMKSSKTSLELTSELTSSVSALMSMVSDVMRSQKEIIDRVSSVEASIAYIRSSIASSAALPLKEDRSRLIGRVDKPPSRAEERRNHGGDSTEDSDVELLEDGAYNQDDRRGKSDDIRLPINGGTESVIEQSKAVESRLMNAMRPGGLELVPELSYGGISEDKYFSTFFVQVMDLYTNLFVSLFNAIQRKCEEDYKVVYTSDASSHYTRTRRLLSVLSKHHSFNATIPDKRDAGHRLVAHALRRREKDLYGIVNGYTFLTMSKNASTASVFRAFCNLLAHLKKVPESMPQPSMTIIENLSVRVCDEEGNILVDYDKVAEASMSLIPRTSMSKSIEYAHISDYVKYRLSGMDPEESLECVRRLPDGHGSGRSTLGTRSSSVQRSPSIDSTSAMAKNTRPRISLRPCPGPPG